MLTCSRYKVLCFPPFLLLLALGYIALSKLSIYFATMSEGISIVWFPNGFLLFLFLVRPMREWLLYASVILPSEIIAYTPTFTYLQALEFGLINLGETMFAAIMIQKFSDSRHNFENIRYFLLFVIVALTLSPALGAILGAAVYHAQIESQNNFLAFWRIWMFGDALGILLFTPLLVTLYEKKKQFFSDSHFSIESFIMIPLTLALAFFLFSSDFSPNLLPSTPIIFILALLWIGYRRGLVESLLMSVLLSMIAIYFTADHKGPFAIFNAVQNTLYLQEFIAAMVTITLFFGVLLQQINEKTAQLTFLSKNLEDQVFKKTNDLQLANQKLFELAIKDSLTHIYNRRFLVERAEQEVSTALRYNSELSLIMFDIDFF